MGMQLFEMHIMDGGPHKLSILKENLYLKSMANYTPLEQQENNPIHLLIGWMDAKPRLRFLEENVIFSNVIYPFFTDIVLPCDQQQL